jgi:hypothetical protein
VTANRSSANLSGVLVPLERFFSGRRSSGLIVVKSLRAASIEWPLLKERQIPLSFTTNMGYGFLEPRPVATTGSGSW